MRDGLRPLSVSLFTGGIDKHYASGLGESLANAGISVDLICNAEMEAGPLQACRGIRFVRLYGGPAGKRGKIGKLLGGLRVYAKLIRYAAVSSSHVFHILWNYKIPLFDRTILLLYYKALGKRVTFTAHNINAGERDGADTPLNRLSLICQYRLVDHIFVHTEKMKDQLVGEFGVRPENVSIIPFATYSMVPQSALSSTQAKQQLGLNPSDRTILFFGRITAYKGVDLLLEAFVRIAKDDKRYRLLIAGEPMKEAEKDWQESVRKIDQGSCKEQIHRCTRFIRDEEIEVFFKGADVLVLPYTQIFQSGVLFMAYSFGLPVIATDVGSFARDVIAGRTGFICRPQDPADLTRALETYFASDLYRNLSERRLDIRDYVEKNHSWSTVACQTRDVYAALGG